MGKKRRAADRRTRRAEADRPHVDWFLRELINMVNWGRVSLPVTFSVGGLLITGELVSGQQYFDSFAEDFKIGADIDSEEAETARVRFSEILRRFGTLYPSKHTEGEPFLHLRNARIIQTGIAQPSGVWWRGRLDAVDGFILGTLTAEIREETPSAE
jgi:hypothetical protein